MVPKNTLPKKAGELLDYLDDQITSGPCGAEAEDTLKKMVMDCKQWEAEDLIDNGSTMDQLSYVFNMLGRTEFLGQLEKHFADT